MKNPVRVRGWLAASIAVLLASGCGGGFGEADIDAAVSEALAEQATATTTAPASTVPPTTTMSLEQCLELAYAFDVWNYDVRYARKQSAKAAEVDNWPLADKWTETAEVAIETRDEFLQQIHENGCTWKPGVQAAMHSSPDPWDTP